MDEKLFYDVIEAETFLKDLRAKFIAWVNSEGHIHTHKAFGQYNLGESHDYLTMVFKKEHAKWIKVFYSNDFLDFKEEGLIQEDGNFI